MMAAVAAMAIVNDDDDDHKPPAGEEDTCDELCSDVTSEWEEFWCKISVWS